MIFIHTRMPENKIPRVYFTDFGCRLNQFETRVLENNSGLTMQTTGCPEEAEFIVINTCTVTNRADVKNRQAIRKARLANPKAHIIVTGCYASTDSEALKQMPEVDTVISNEDKFTIPDFISGKKTEGIRNLFPASNQNLTQSARAYLKIQDGCNKRCSYCKVPMARGRAVSRDLEDSFIEILNLTKNGFQEIILTGVNIGHYRNGQIRLNDFLKRLEDIPGDHYYRISSIEPDCVNNEFLDIIASDKFARFLHIPLQSGSNRVLKSMRRGYSTNEYIEIIQQAREKIADVHIGTDVMAGFPGETPEDFQMTFDLVEKIQFANVHFFPFSRRSGSEIDEILRSQKKDLQEIRNESRVPVFEINGEITRMRIQQLQILQTENQKKYIENTSGKPFRAIIEKEVAGALHIVTENFLKGTVVSRGSFQKGQKIQIKYDPRLQFSWIE